MDRIDALIQKHSAEFDALRQELAMNFNVPAQRLINCAFARIGVQRFDNTGDVWEQIVCRQNGWEYEVPPAELMRRWALY